MKSDKCVQNDTHSAVHVGFRPHRVVFVVDDFGSTHDVKVPHHVLLDVCQSGDLTEVACKTMIRVRLQWQCIQKNMIYHQGGQLLIIIN